MIILSTIGLATVIAIVYLGFHWFINGGKK